VDFEIERRFLVCGNGWRDLAAKHTDIRQAYLTVGNKASVRVRISDNSAATLTVKSRPPKLRRLELEYGIPIYQAEALIALREGAVVEKRRYQLPCGDISWEVDVFSGENLGLVIAEIELCHEHQQIALPPWIGLEVTGRLPYSNGFLAHHPFSSWREGDADREVGCGGLQLSRHLSLSSLQPP
jgi:adenylate cyclase